MHLELDGEMTLTESHDIATEVEVTLRERYKDCQVLVHQEPHGLEDHKLDLEIGTP
ncbi:MAG: cation transporter dimerization domain-containing protein [Myxococcota bacterium]